MKTSVFAVRAVLGRSDTGNYRTVAALARYIENLGVHERVVVALHEDADLRAAIDLHPARRLAHSAHEDVRRVCAQRACSDVTTISGIESLRSLLLAVEHPPLIVVQRGVGHEVLGGRERLPIPAEHRHAHVAVASRPVADPGTS